MGLIGRGLILVFCGFLLSVFVRISGSSISLSGAEQPFVTFMMNILATLHLDTLLPDFLLNIIRLLFTFTPVLAILSGIYYSLGGGSGGHS